MECTLVAAEETSEFKKQLVKAVHTFKTYVIRREVLEQERVILQKAISRRCSAKI